jgi:hypothetical protein
MLSFHPVSGSAVAPFSLTYSDGQHTYVQQNVQDAIPFPVPVPPLVNTNYPLISIQDASSCAATPVSGEAATILVYPSPVLQVSPDTGICSGSSLQLRVSGANTYQWTPAIYLDNNMAPGPTATPPATTRFYVTGTDAQLCPGEGFDTGIDPSQSRFHRAGRYQCLHRQQRAVKQLQRFEIQISMVARQLAR